MKSEPKSTRDKTCSMIWPFSWLMLTLSSGEAAISACTAELNVLQEKTASGEGGPED